MLFNSIIWLAKKIGEAVDTEITARREGYMLELRELHKALETGEVSEEEFDQREEAILEALDALDRIHEGVETHER